MSFIDDLNKAVGMFDNQVQTYKSTKAFSEASEQINQINSSMVKEAEKRQAITQVSMGLAQNLLNAGAPVARIDAALKAFAPAPLMSSEEQIAIGTQFDDKETLKRGQAQQTATGAVPYQRQLGAMTHQANLNAKLHSQKDAKQSAVYGDVVAQKIQTMVPKKLQGEAFKQVGIERQFRMNMNQLNTYLKQASDIKAWDALPFESKKAKLGGIQANITGFAMSAIKGAASDEDIRRQVDPFLPMATDTTDQINEKMLGLEQFLASRKLPTEMISRFGISEALEPSAIEQQQESTKVLSVLQKGNFTNLNEDSLKLLTNEDISRLNPHDRLKFLTAVKALKQKGK